MHVTADLLLLTDRQRLADLIECFTESRIAFFVPPITAVLLRWRRCRTARHRSSVLVHVCKPDTPRYYASDGSFAHSPSHTSMDPISGSSFADCCRSI